jgi:hypothetical protein
MASIKYKIRKYEKIIMEFLSETLNFRNQLANFHLLVTDKERKHYQLFFSGWYDADCFEHTLLMHLHINEEGKIWILANETETQIKLELQNRGVIAADIIVAFASPIQKVA